LVGIRRSRPRTIVAMLALIVGLIASVGLVTASGASAHAGAIGSLDSASNKETPPCQTCSTGLNTITVTGWAYNGHTVPVQSVAIWVHTPLESGWAKPELIANKYRPDVLRAHAATTAYVGFSGTVTFYSSVPIDYICAYAHDKGELNGLVALNNSCRYV
jgi:hypothetical protein